jgi:hypothetical protein
MNEAVSISTTEQLAEFIESRLQGIFTPSHHKSNKELLTEYLESFKNQIVSIVRLQNNVDST